MMSEGTRNIVAAMKSCSIGKVVVCLSGRRPMKYLEVTSSCLLDRIYS